MMHRRLNTRWKQTATMGTALALALVCGSAMTAVGAPGPRPAGADSDSDLAQYVNPYVGTQPGADDQGTGGGAGNNFPGADAPFGMVQWSPDTVTGQHGGYYYPDNRIRGFSLTHLSGAGCDTYEDIPFMPFVGDVTDSPATDPNHYISTFSHSNEKVSPGYYGVTLDSGVHTELTVTQRTGSARLTYPAGRPATLLVNTSGSVTGTSDSNVTIGANTISGWANSGDFCGSGDHYRVYFYAQFDQNFASVGTWHDGTISPNAKTARGGAPTKPAVAATNKKIADLSPEANSPLANSAKPRDVTASGPGTGGYVTFDTTTPPTVNVRVGLSFTSIAGAMGNLAAENNGTSSFDQLAALARQTWNTRLNEIQVTGGTDEQKRTFYTSLYHVLLQPNVFSDADGQYTGFDGQVHTVAAGHAIYTNFSGWDIYRSECQLLALLAPAETSDIANSMMQFAAQGGSWDRWTVANDYTGVMVGDPYHIIVSTAYAFGATGFDAKAAELSMVKGATAPTSPPIRYVERPGLAQYEQLGYVPGDAATTLEYTSADFAIAQFAKRLGDSATYDQFAPRTQYWQNLYNPNTGYLQPRNADGSFNGNYNPASPTGYVEGNGAQYTWMVPYNEAGLINTLGGNAAVNKRLDTFFSQLNVGPHQPYAFLSNEPTLETPWLYDYTGTPASTANTVHKVETQLFNSSPAGLQGNDDLGEMGSWYVWSAMGLYPEIPGRAELLVTSPEFSQVVINTEAGKKFTINAPGASNSTEYVTGLNVDGQPSTKAWLPESFAENGGTLDFTLSATPSPTWGTAPTDAPPSFRDDEKAASTYVDPARLVIPPGGTDKASIGAQNLEGTDMTVSWTANPPAGITLSVTSGTVTVPKGGKADSPVNVSVAAGTAIGTYHVPISFIGPAGTTLSPTSLTVLVAQPGGLVAAYDDVGVSPDDNTSVADFDGGGFSYSAAALTKVGITRGGAVTVSGLSTTWPPGGVGDPDNVMAQGQTIKLSPSGSPTQLALLGSAANGNASGTLTITYTDGSTQTATIGFSDWTLNAGSKQPAFGNTIVAQMPYRNRASGGNQQITTYLFGSAPIALAAGKQVASITLPSSLTGGEMHVFAIALG